MIAAKLLAHLSALATSLSCTRLKAESEIPWPRRRKLIQSLRNEMLTPFPRLFNNPTLSDVKLKQICDGKTREYYAHKAIHCF